MSLDIDYSTKDGETWVCAACGKHKTGTAKPDRDSCFGWDASCMLNSVLCKTDSMVITNGRVTYADPVTQPTKLKEVSDVSTN